VTKVLLAATRGSGQDGGVHRHVPRRRDGEAIDDYRDRLRAGFVHRAQRTGTVIVVCLVIWLFTGGGFWPAWVLLFCGIGLVKHARRAFAPVYDDADDDEFLNSV
jgi:hypothetical protein